MLEVQSALSSASTIQSTSDIQPISQSASSVDVPNVSDSISNEFMQHSALHRETRAQTKSLIPPKIRILSDFTIKPAMNITEILADPLKQSDVYTHVSLPSTSMSVSVLQVPTCSASPTYGIVSTSDLSSTEITPRKRKLLNKLERVERVSARRKLKLTLLKRKMARKEKKISNMKAIISGLKEKKLMEEDTLDLLSRLGGPQEFYFRQYRKSLKKTLPKKYSEELKVFALTLHYYSPAAYKYVRRTFNTCLPHTRTISRWYQSINGLPGFTSEAFEALKLKAGASENEIICALVMDEMAIRQHEEWVPSQGKSYGYVDMGTGSQENIIASNALVFLLNCINGNWKIPVGYFLIAGIKAESKKGLVIECLKKCFEAGIKVVSLTFDGAPTNLTMAKILGCDLNYTSLKTSFQHPSKNGDEVVVLLDPCHMVKLVRNTLGEKGLMANGENGLIRWKFFTQLHELQEKEGFHLANKLREQHIKFVKQKMKVRLATQLFSESVANSLDFCSQNLKLSDFNDVGPTVEFVKIMNSLFDILNSRNLCQFSYKKPLSIKNADIILTFLDKADLYLRGLKTATNGSLLLNTNRHTGFLGLLVCIRSIKVLYSNLILPEHLKFLPTYKLSQDCLELFFCSIRAQGGYNNNPTARQFQAAYKKLLVHVELKESFRGNCIPLEELYILKLNPVHQINITSRQYSVSDLPTFDYTALHNDHDYLPDPVSAYAKHIITYIAGYIVYYLKKHIVCEYCLNSLDSTSRGSFLYSFIDLKNKKGLQYPSDDVIEICLKCEKVLKNEISVVGLSKVSIDYLKNLILREFVTANVFRNLVIHSFDQFALDNHRCLLIKSIIERYLNIRLIYLSKRKTDKNRAVSIRHTSNKIVLFSGQ